MYQTLMIFVRKMNLNTSDETNTMNIKVEYIEQDELQNNIDWKHDNNSSLRLGSKNNDSNRLVFLVCLYKDGFFYAQTKQRNDAYIIKIEYRFKLVEKYAQNEDIFYWFEIE